LARRLTFMKTRITQMIGIDHPILQGGMAWVATAELAAAVSEAGGLGIIGAGNMPADFVKREIDKAKALTARPFGVNIMLLSPYVDDVVDVVLAAGVQVVTTGAGNPGKYLDAFRRIGTKVIPVVPSVALARRLERLGVDALIAEGHEAGGHIGELTTMVLVPQIADAVSIPVIAAGGIADSRGIAAALALGAEAVQIGTRFVCASECTAHDNYKRAIIAAEDRDATVTGRVTGHPVRCLRNRLTRQLAAMESSGCTAEDVESLGAGKLRQAAVEGDVDEGSVMAGQSAGMVSRIQPAAEIVQELMDGLHAVMHRLDSIIQP
jgi:enoyl-[acyl-carrier protein] reductase II